MELKRKRLPVSISAAVLIEDEKGRLLLVQQEAKWKEGEWGPPAGRVHAFESPTEVALRETKEETGLEVELIDLVGVYTVPRGAHTTSIGFVFRGKIVSGKIALQKGEIKNCKYFSPKKLEELIKKDEIYKPEFSIPVIKDWQAGKSYPLEIIRPIKKE